MAMTAVFNISTFSPYPQIITKLSGDFHYVVNWQSELMPSYRKLQAR
jgi:hypothetical protein